MKKILKNQAGFSTVAIIVAVVVVIAAIGIVYILHPGKEEPIKIGAVLSLSGPGQYSGVEVRDGMLLAVDEVNSRGGINGKKIELIIEDHKTNPEEGKEAFDKIERTHHPVFYLSTHSSVAMALAPLVEEHQVVLVCLLATAPKITEHKEWVFRYWPTAEAEVPPILSILEELKVKKLGILYQDNEFGKSILELLQKGFKRTGRIVEAEGLKPAITDLKESITGLIDMEAIYVTGYIGLLENIFKQLKEENFRGSILSMNNATFPTIVTIPESQGIYVAAPVIYNPNFSFAKEIEGKYVTRYDKPFNHAAAVGYDFIRLLAGMLEDEEVSRESIKSLLEEGFIYSGVFGSVDLKPGEHDITFPLHPARIVDGEVKYLRW